MTYKYKTEGKSPKDFRNYQNLIELFKSLRDGNVNPREVLKNQTNFKLDRGKTRKGIPKSKSKDQISVIQNVENFFDLTEKIIDYYYLGIIISCYPKLNIKQNMEKDWKY